ncbi:hypothetical protein, partial [Actinoplanes sp. ATCC 53533]|uniref:hypothetical protein n=1 Tax=Actinoplanes sp. ATCC 53533 TaxID=1288362 RepID=UPI0011D17205
MDLVTGQHWLYDWIDEFEITESDTLRQRIRFPGAMNRLYELAKGADKTQPSPAAIPASLLASMGMDVPSGLCSAAACRTRAIDREFGQLLHYFDYFLMQGPTHKTYLNILDSRRGNDWFQDFFTSLWNDVTMLLHLRKIGMDRYIVFINKPTSAPRAEVDSWISSLHTPLLNSIAEIAEVAKLVSREGGVEIEQTGPRRWSVGLVHPLFSGSPGMRVVQKTRPKKAAAAAALIQQQMSALFFDSQAAKEHGAPPVSLLEPSFFQRDKTTGAATVDQVALNLDIPVLANLETAELLKLRESEYEHFERFRKTLVEAIAEAIEKATTEDPEKIARSVWRDTIEPEVADIQSKISASKRSLSFKLAAGIAVGSATTAFGALAAMP